MLIVIYEYPAGPDSSQRVTDLINIFAMVEAIPAKI
jgi:hypothetical protein